MSFFTSRSESDDQESAGSDVPESRSGFRRRLKTVRRILARILKWSLIVLLTLAILGFVVERIVRIAVRNQYEPLGELVNVDGRLVHYIAKGTGSPTVVFESGLCSSSNAWKGVQTATSLSTRTISYDRAGVKWSESLAGPRTGKQIASELFDFLTAIGETGPFILVGHSMGGPYVRVFADEHPDLVAGMILVDSSHPNQYNKLPDDFLLAPPWWQLALFRIAAETGALRLVPLDLPDDTKAMLPMMASAIIGEVRGLQTSLMQAADTRSLGDKPLVVISQNVVEGVAPQDANAFLQIWHELQRDLLTLSTNSRHIIATNSSHDIPNKQPYLITNAIKDMVAELRHND